jgi:diacylglycerol kinase (ATP)
MLAGMKAILVHNPSAGRGDISREALIDLLHNAGYTPMYQSSSVGELTAALSEPADVIVIAGGDGTVCKVLNQMPARDVPVAILPLGTANNIASSFGIGGPIAEIAVRLHTAERRQLDVGQATGPWGRSWFIEGAGLGALVRLADSFNGRKDKGEARLDAARRALRELLKDIEPDRVELLLDGRPLPARHLMVEVLNIAYGGPRLLFAPDVDPGDGQLDVLLLESERREDMRQWLKDEPVGRPPMTQLRGRKISIVWDGTPLHVDDDLPPAIKGLAAVELELTREPASILVPAVNGRPGVAE